MASSCAAAHRRLRPLVKVFAIVGATGCGKSRLSMDLASRFPCEVINSDKMQLYRGLDITTNKIPLAERHGVPHHLLSSFDPNGGEMTPTEFRSRGHAAISGVVSGGKLPLVVGGSNSFIHALLVERFDPEADVFSGLGSAASPELRYDCCFLWVDVSPPVLEEYQSKRVDKKLDMGAFDELAGYHDLRRTNTGGWTCLRKAIGVPEFDRYFMTYPPPRGVGLGDGWRREDARMREDDPVRDGAYKEAVRKIKKNAVELAKWQIMKIERLRGSGWEMHRLDATEAVRLKMAAKEEGGGRSREVWEREVVEPSVKFVERFLLKKQVACYLS